MRRLLAVCGLATAIILLWGPDNDASLGLSLEIPSSKPYKSDLLPARVVRAINAVPRVYGWGQDSDGCNDGTHYLYFKGNTKQLNAFLKDLATMADGRNATPKVRLMPGPGRAKTHGFLGSGKTFDFNWSVTLERWRVYGEGVSVARGDTLTTIQKVVGRSWHVTVNIYVDGPIDLGTLELPLAYKATVGGRIGAFVYRHNQRVKRTRARRPRADTRPTTEGEHVKTRGGLFGLPDGATTQSIEWPTTSRLFSP